MFKKPSLSSTNNWQDNHKFALILCLSTVFLFWGVWWGWPRSFDQHDPTNSAIKMLWNRTLDPGKRYWGAFAYQEILFLSVIPVTVLKKIFALDSDLAQALMYLTTRILWALKGLAIVLMTYFTSKELFHNRRAALISMFFLAVSPGFIAWAHIPQVDIAHTFWYALAVTFTAAGWHRSSLRLLWFAAIAAGLAASVKYIGGVIVLAPVTVAFMRFATGRAIGLGSLFMLTALVVFFITTPLATGSPLQWFPEYTADVLANQHRELDNPIALWTMPGAIWDLLGPATSILGIIGVFFLWFAKGKKHQDRQAWWVLAACFLPYYLCLSWQHVATVRYVIPLVSVILTAVGIVIALALEKSPGIRPLSWCIVLAGAVQIALTTGLVAGFSTDTRIELVAWLEENTKPTDRVEMILNHRPFFVSKPSFLVINRPHFQAETYEMKKRIEEDKGSTIRKLHDALVRQTGKDPEKLLTWVDKERKWLKKSAATFDTSIHGPVIRQSKYIVMNINTASFYILDWPGVDPESPNEKEFVRALLEESGPFKQVARFDSIVPNWLRYPRELWFNVSPPIAVFEVSASSS